MPPPPALAVDAPASARGLPRAVRAGCDRPCVVEARLVAPPSAVLRVVAGTRGPALLARTRALVPAGAAPVRLVPTPLGRRLLAGGAPGRLAATLRVTAADATGPVGAAERPLALGPDRPWTAVVGRSARGRPLVALLPAGPADGLVVAAIHGDESVTARTLTAALAGVTGTRLRWAVVPVANPDGAVAGSRRSARGVDLNRNFPSRDWGSPAAVAPGPRAASEPETRALTGLVRRLAPARLLTLHAPLALVEDPRRSPLGRHLAAAAGLPLRPDVGYPTPGSMGTWAEDRGIPDVTLELAPGGVRPAVVRALRTVLTGGVP